ncbi:MAG: hypothetical protein HQM10_24685 [Candidatus Riflebacteria bacterium]|nr:hypothetical protein [Candidatus Riflebacteria bacterium]
MKKTFMPLILILLLTFLNISTAVFSQGSVLDTIHSAEESGQDAGYIPEDPVNNSPSEQVFLEESSPEPIAARECPLSGQTSYNMSEQQYQEMITKIVNQIIQQLISIYGVNGLSGKTIVIIIPPFNPPADTTTSVNTNTRVDTSTNTYTNTNTNVNTSTKTYTNTNTSSSTSTSTSTNTSTDTINGLKAEMRSKYGISANDGSSSWSLRQLQEANKVLATLPQKFLTSTKSIKRDAVFQSPNVLGYVQMGIPEVHMLNSSCYQGTFQGTLVHEMTHCFQSENPQAYYDFKNTFWSGGRQNSSSVSSYGNTQPIEDMAECVRMYWQAGSAMKARYPDRYEFIKNRVMDGKEF